MARIIDGDKTNCTGAQIKKAQKIAKNEPTAAFKFAGTARRLCLQRFRFQNRGSITNSYGY